MSRKRMSFSLNFICFCIHFIPRCSFWRNTPPWNKVCSKLFLWKYLFAYQNHFDIRQEKWKMFLRLNLQTKTWGGNLKKQLNKEFEKRTWITKLHKEFGLGIWKKRFTSYQNDPCIEADALYPKFETFILWQCCRVRGFPRY